MGGLRDRHPGGRRRRRHDADRHAAQQRPPTTTTAHLEVKRATARGRIHTDVGFWGGAVPGNTKDLRPLHDAGVFGFKCFLLPSGVEEFPQLAPAELEEAMREIARFDGLLIVHAEDPGSSTAPRSPPGPRTPASSPPAPAPPRTPPSRR